MSHRCGCHHRRAAAFLVSAVEPTVTVVTVVPAQQGARKVAPRVQVWLDRKAEGLVYAEKEKAAVFAEQKRAEARRMKISSTAEHAAFAEARNEEKKPPSQKPYPNEGTVRSETARGDLVSYAMQNAPDPLASLRSNPCNTIRACTGEASRPSLFTPRESGQMQPAVEHGRR